MSLDQLEYILDHYKNPRNYGTLPDADVSYEEGNPSCGDVVRIDLKIEDNKVVDAKFSGQGCTISQASASILTEMIIGKSLEEIREITKEDMLNALGIRISPIRFKCALLALKVLKSGLYGVKNWPGEEEER
ncbi:MAG: iron-sulfur cluster scaffold-like protein [Deltaproteobacteria bacterium]|jgi:nitrogen fixation NifU-like protein|nr:MAG: iron-sulfur cluster scaffold-like protein [Deltaproteobacteria bacterium]